MLELQLNLELLPSTEEHIFKIVGSLSNQVIGTLNISCDLPGTTYHHHLPTPQKSSYSVCNEENVSEADAAPTVEEQPPLRKLSFGNATYSECNMSGEEDFLVPKNKYSCLESLQVVKDADVNDDSNVHSSHSDAKSTSSNNDCNIRRSLRQRKTGYTCVVLPPTDDALDYVSISSKSLNSSGEEADIKDDRIEEASDETSPQPQTVDDDDNARELSPPSTKVAASVQRRTVRRRKLGSTNPDKSFLSQQGSDTVDAAALSYSCWEKSGGETTSNKKLSNVALENLSQDFNKLCGVRRRSTSSVELSYRKESHCNLLSCKVCDFACRDEVEMKRHASKRHPNWKFTSMVQPGGVSSKRTKRRKGSSLGAGSIAQDTSSESGTRLKKKSLRCGSGDKPS